MAKAAQRLFICLDNSRYEVSLERRKIYVALPDVKAERAGYLRIVDESGEDYLYPVRRFIAAELPVSTRRAVLHAANNRIERSRGITFVEPRSGSMIGINQIRFGAAQARVAQPHRRSQMKQ